MQSSHATRRTMLILLWASLPLAGASAQPAEEPPPGPQPAPAKPQAEPIPPPSNPETPVTAAALSAPAPSSEGRRLYRKACAPCHGIRGDGEGPAARFLDPPPRDFTTGNYKFRSTPSGAVPLTEDLIRTVSEGIPGTFMPRWKEHLSGAEIAQVVEYLRELSPRFREEVPERVVPPADSLAPPESTEELIRRGEVLYRELQCTKCHGDAGRGDGPSAAELRDDLGRPILPTDFGAGRFRGGARPEDLYRTMVSGLSGTPMPAYGESIAEERDRWALAHYLRSLRRPGGVAGYLFGPQTPWE
ncbi:MAG: c-type cytochrome [Myxococcales bacterium]|nr:c-type cytochrome [Myxococcales bacterium]